MPSCHTTYDVRLFKAINFPYTWTYESTIITGKEFVDPCIFLYKDTWWLFVATDNYELWVYYSDNLTDPRSWTMHPSSPVMSDKSKARPGGRVVVLANGRIIRHSQKCDVSYGEKVRAFEIDILTKTSYAEHEILESPVLEPCDSGWNKDGMHNVDPWWIGDRWLVAVDGVCDRTWSIGIYVTPSYVHR